MSLGFSQSSAFVEVRERIEEHLYDSVLEIEQDQDRAIESVQNFAEAIDRLMDTLEQIYQTPKIEDTIGEKSFPIREGRYRVFYKVVVKGDQDFEIVFLDIDDNRQSNLDRYPEHKLITLESDTDF